MIRTALLASCLLAVTVLTGCNNTVKSSDLRSNWTPELKSVTLSEEELANFRSRHRHNTWRQIHDDWATLWLENRNIRLTEYNLP
jgi:hypothetical protein